VVYVSVISTFRREVLEILDPWRRDQ